MATTSDPRDERIKQLEALLTLALAEIGTLKARIAQLEAQLGQNSQNSSKPPSSDGPGAARPGAKPTGRKRGGQPGHKGSERRRLPPNKVVEHWPERCRCCDRRLSKEAALPEPKWAQLIELPEMRPLVDEHQAFACRCDCGAITQARLPNEVLLHGFGPRLSALVAWLTARGRLSKRQVMEFLGDALGVPISLGAVCAIEKDVSEALAKPVEEARTAVREQPVAHADETGWREDKKRAWLWVVVTAVATVFRVARSRGSGVAREMLGECYRGTTVSDRWSGYNWLPIEQRQLCWAHLKRDFKGMVERGELGGHYGQRLLDHTDKMFEWWSQLRDGTVSRATFQRRMKPVRAEVGRLLREASSRAEKKTAGMCAEILKLEGALWTFIDAEGVDPTNNAAERSIRPAVLWRKGSFGTDSAVGSRFVERVLTVIATVRQHGGGVLAYLTDACAAHRRDGSTPSLLNLAVAH